jgi:hypothetical protein
VYSEVCGLLIFIFIQHYIYSYTLMWISAFWSFYTVVYFLHRGFYTPRRGRRAVSVALGRGSPASQALTLEVSRRGPHVQPPCPQSGRRNGALHALWRAAPRAPRGARKALRSGSANDTRLAPPACSELPERARMDTSFPARVAVACVAWDGTRPADTESSTAGAGGRLQSAIIVRRRD